jgi:tetratricopeptide (TPR) repeat protein
MNQGELKNSMRAEASSGTPVRNGSTPDLRDELAAQMQSEKAGALVMSARSAQRKGDKTKARELLRQAFTIDANDCGGLELLGDLFMEDSEHEKALKIFERGLQHHPKHRAFEEKIGLCHVDLAEMRRDRDRRAQILEQGGVEKWMLLSAPRAFGLSAILPGAGQAYIGQNKRALTMLGLAVFTFLAWALPLYFGLKRAAENGGTRGIKALFGGFQQALSGMSSFSLLWFWLMVAAWVAVYTYAALDAMTQAEKINELRKQGWDVPDDDF